MPGPRTQVTRIEGLKTVQRRLEAIRKRIPNALMAELTVEGELVMTRSKRDFVPVMTGKLRNTGTVHDGRYEGDYIKVRLTYGGLDAPYAVKQHEDLTLTHPRGKSAKYLSRPLQQLAPSMVYRIAKRLGQDLRGFAISDSTTVHTARISFG